MRKSLSVELRQGKFVLNTNVLRRTKKSSNEGISKNSLNPNINLLRDAMKQWHVSMRISINFLFPCMITGLNSPRWLSNAILLKLLHHDLDKKLEKGGGSLSFTDFVLSPLKYYRSGKIVRLNILSKSLVSSQKTSDGRCYQFLFPLHFCF